MTASSPWQVLEIEPTGDVVAIRRAYRARLRRTGAADAARLQAAYESALAALPASVPAEPVASSGNEAIETALGREDPVETANLIADGRSASTLSLRDDMQAVQRLLAHLTTGQTHSLDQIERAARLLGWLDDRSELPVGAAFDRLRSRLAAERWLRRLGETADRYRAFDPEAAAARRLLGRKPSIADRMVASRAALASLLTELDRHGEWIEHQLDSVCVAEARRIVRSEP